MASDCTAPKWIYVPPTPPLRLYYLLLVRPLLAGDPDSMLLELCEVNDD